MTIVSTKEEYLIVDRRGAAYFEELGNGLKQHVFIHVAICHLMDFPVQWYVVMEIMVVILGLVNNDGRHKHRPSALVNTSKVHHNGAKSPVSTFHIISP